MTTQASPSTFGAELATPLPQSLINWLARRRIAISLVGFTSLVVFNVFFAGTVPYNPLDLGQPLVAIGMGLLAIGLLIRTWSAGTLNKSRELTTQGPYAVVRNPLYVGSFSMMFGFCILCRDLPTLLFVAGPMSLLYWIQVRFEEQRLAGMFPDQWPAYEQTVPRFLPRRIDRSVRSGWSWMEWRRNREYKAVAASMVGLAAVILWYWASHA